MKAEGVLLGVEVVQAGKRGDGSLYGAFSLLSWVDSDCGESSKDMLADTVDVARLQAMPRMQKVKVTLERSQDKKGTTRLRVVDVVAA